MSDQSFVTVIIDAHGEDLKSDIALPSQVRTLRKFTIPGKSGHLTYLFRELYDTIFDISHQLALSPHIPFTKKLGILKTELNNRPHLREKLQSNYECQPAEVKAENTSCPRASDWFSTSKVRYNHMYSFVVNDPTFPWEQDEFGIWLVDGSPHILQSEMRSSSRDYKPKNNITNRINIPTMGFEITLFELAEKLKLLFNVKYVNFIDLSCRFREVEVDRSWTSRIKSRVSSLFGWSDDVPSAEVREITPRAVEQPIYEFNGMEIEIMDYQSRLPPNWFYVKNIRDNTYVYVNPATGEMSVDFPDFPESVPRKENIFVQGLEMEIVDPPKIEGVAPRKLPPDWEYVKLLQSNTHSYVNTTTGEMNPFFPGRIRSDERGGGGSKQTKKKTKKRKNK